MFNQPIARRSALGLIAAAPLGAARAARAATNAVLSGPITAFEARPIMPMEAARPSCRYVAVARGMIAALSDRLAKLEPWTTGRAVKLDRSLSPYVVLPGLIDPYLQPVQAADLVRGGLKISVGSARLSGWMCRGACTAISTWPRLIRSIWHGLPPIGSRNRAA